MLRFSRFSDKREAECVERSFALVNTDSHNHVRAALCRPVVVSVSSSTGIQPSKSRREVKTARVQLLLDGR